MSEIQRIIDQMLRIEVHREFMKHFEEDTVVPPGWEGFLGIRGIFDEWERLPPLPPLSWTPDEFNRMWRTLTHESRVNYVLNLIS